MRSGRLFVHRPGCQRLRSTPDPNPAAGFARLPDRTARHPVAGRQYTAQLFTDRWRCRQRTDPLAGKRYRPATGSVGHTGSRCSRLVLSDRHRYPFRLLVHRHGCRLVFERQLRALSISPPLLRFTQRRAPVLCGQPISLLLHYRRIHCGYARHGHPVQRPVDAHPALRKRSGLRGLRLQLRRQCRIGIPSLLRSRRHGRQFAGRRPCGRPEQRGHRNARVQRTKPRGLLHAGDRGPDG